ncbi:hypothetical protein GUJ93_ZPchr0007g6256 [Zizania palustris]|uniref:Stomagen C-terminal domain-containing protein n=1 Tax=Zizania palustris TaxID=103762 RepID=A0A8J5SMK9_ZIZPA|nr:hypothetical protein GUJ93_ZPchr0007g6256 [Zizania palustris]
MSGPAALDAGQGAEECYHGDGSLRVGQLAGDGYEIECFMGEMEKKNGSSSSADWSWELVMANVFPTPITRSLPLFLLLCCLLISHALCNQGHHGSILGTDYGEQYPHQAFPQEHIHFQENVKVLNKERHPKYARRMLIGSTAPICTFNECRGCRFKCTAEQVPVDANDPINSAYHYKCVCHSKRDLELRETEQLLQTWPVSNVKGSVYKARELFRLAAKKTNSASSNGLRISMQISQREQKVTLNCKCSLCRFIKKA